MTQAHHFHRSLLREYDIRGIVGTTLHEADARAIGRGFATIVRRKGGHRVAVGFDGRLSSPAMEAAVVEGLNAGGVEALRIGRGPTPMLYFAVVHLEADGGIMITGSHNPPDYNGFKFMLGRKAFYGDDIQGIGRLAATADWTEGRAGSSTHDVADAYLDGLAGAWRAEGSLDVAWDAGNGATGEILERLVQRLPGRHVALNATIDGTFPVHHPDPTVPENLEQLIADVVDNGRDLGIAFDGDGDRIGVVDGMGRILWGDQLLVLLGRDVLKERPGATIIADVKASQVFFDEIRAAGGRPLMWRTGHSLIKSKMAETGAPLAGEMSGHIFFADRWYGFDDALYAAVRLLDVVARAGVSLAELREGLPEVLNTPEVRFDCDEDRKFGVVAEVRDRLAAAGADVDATDGVRVTTEDGWWLLRASNTQPVLVARCEARDADGLERLKQAVRETLRQSGLEAPAGF